MKRIWMRMLKAIRDWCCKKAGHDWIPLELTFETPIQILASETYYLCLSCDKIKKTEVDNAHVDGLESDC